MFNIHVYFIAIFEIEIGNVESKFTIKNKI